MEIPSLIFCRRTTGWHDQLEDAYKQINASLASDLLSEVLKITPYTFEKLVVDLLSKMGYGTVAYGSHATVASGDDGIDGVIMEDKLGFSLIYMQAKEWAPDRVVGQPDIQSFVGAIAGKHGDGIKAHIRSNFDYHFVMYVHRATAVRERLHFNGHDGGVLTKRNDSEW